jgi:hypothetical protein
MDHLGSLLRNEATALNKSVAEAKERKVYILTVSLCRVDNYCLSKTCLRMRCIFNKQHCVFEKSPVW